MPFRFSIFRNSDNRFHFNLRNGSRERILSSNGYLEKSACQKSLVQLKSSVAFDANFQKTATANGQFYFVIKSNEGTILGKSELYFTKYACDNAIALIIKEVPLAHVEDLT